MLYRESGASLMVAHCCPAARAIGIRSGMSLGQAQALAPHLQATPDEPVADRLLLERMARWAQRFSPVVQPLLPPEPAGLLADVTGCARLFGGEEHLARQAIEGLERRGFRARVAIADTVGAAYALAISSPEAITVVFEGQTAAWLSPLPPSSLRMDPQTASDLHNLGVRTVGDLLALPRSSLPARFGEQIVRRIGQALGEIFEGIVAHRPEDPPCSRVTFEESVRDLSTLQAVAGRHVDEVLRELDVRNRAIRRLCVTLFFEAGCEHARRPPEEIVIGLSRGSRSLRHVFELLSRRLERIDLALGVIGLVLRVLQTARWRPPQPELFKPRPPEQEDEFGQLLDRLANRLGYPAIVRPRLVDDHQPEMAFRYVSVAEAGTQTGVGTWESGKERTGSPFGRWGGKVGMEKATRAGLPEAGMPAVRPLGTEFDVPTFSLSRVPTPSECARPLRLLPRPVPVRVMSLVPDGPPAWMFYNGRDHSLVRASGPERIETAWWRGPDVRRDYYRVTSDRGEQFWIFREMTRGDWFLHGVFT